MSWSPSHVPQFLFQILCGFQNWAEKVNERGGDWTSFISQVFMAASSQGWTAGFGHQEGHSHSIIWVSDCQVVFILFCIKPGPSPRAPGPAGLCWARTDDLSDGLFQVTEMTQQGLAWAFAWVPWVKTHWCYYDLREGSLPRTTPWDWTWRWLPWPHPPSQEGGTLQGRSRRKGAFLRGWKRPEQWTLQGLLYIWSEPPMGSALAFNKRSTTRVLEFPVTQIPVP